ncbi:1,4-dihydroxy-6-naphthoate synthase [Desulfovibrio litoralis]|uniref:1,4-dihydroxy-6-naphtoate synthase n=1 Tax=Desulfovibrio litoralis DSM 11393 TaxID=1121455 RepID=A0A1M7TEV8_9BACT|nr:1,4-dihydroxy-6-naphthoate synthase [Desulfovibrio litoralis]SHN69227.1 1,4-dihydroxy-6-naphthoate synthase [Desulfovibrio litoralis DSM 11393]
MQSLTVGISPCPNDTYIFHALIKNLVASPASCRWFLEDVETLNLALINKDFIADFDVCKVSIGALPYILDEYVVLRSGGALGLGCGPVLLAEKGTTLEALKDISLAVPGLYTTANNLLSVYGRMNNTFYGERVPLRFDLIMPAIQEKRFKAGVVIHEGRFTYQDYGLECLLDLGQWWEGTFNLPLPLGVIVAKRSLGYKNLLALEEAIRRSIKYAEANPLVTLSYIKEHAQELNDAVIASHINTFVTKWSYNYDKSGEEAILTFLKHHSNSENKKIDFHTVFVE